MRSFRDKPVGEAAAELVTGERQQDYGDPLANLPDIAAGWGRILGSRVTSRQVCHMMIWLKICRDINGSAGRDNEVDICGYAHLLQFDREDRESREPGPLDIPKPDVSSYRCEHGLLPEDECPECNKRRSR